MSDDKRVQVKKTTPRGIAVWPKLDEPDTKFEAEGVYTTKLKLSAEDAQPYVDLIDKLAADHLAACQKAESNPAKKKKLKLTDDMPYKPDLDKEGNETGDMILSFKMKASGVSKKTGKPWTRKPAAFDAKGRPLTPVPKIGGGSTIKVSCIYEPWANPKGEVGVSARLEAVQLIELRTFGDRSAAEHGFGEEEDGYEAEAATAQTAGFTDESGSESDDDAKHASDF